MTALLTAPVPDLDAGPREARSRRYLMCPPNLRWLADADLKGVTEGVHTNEGEGDSDGRNVVLDPRATGLIGQLRERGYNPIGVDLTELHKAGGGAKCCTLEIRA